MPRPQAQKNFTDPDSRIMMDSSSKSFMQAYNAQAVVDGEAQVIVAAAVTQEVNDKEQLAPMLKEAAANAGQTPLVASADAGYFSSKAVEDKGLAGVDLYVPPNKQKHGDVSPPADDTAPEDGPADERMRHKLRTDQGRDIYRKRKAIVDVWTDKRGPRFSAVLSARVRPGGRGVGPNLPNPQPAQAVPKRAVAGGRWGVEDEVFRQNLCHIRSPEQAATTCRLPGYSAETYGLIV